MPSIFSRKNGSRRPGDPDEEKPIIHFTDAIGRTFKFPFVIAKDWHGVEGLIQEAFKQVDALKERVMEGRYDLMDHDGDVILPSAWEISIKPWVEITMVMLPMDKTSPISPQNHPRSARQQEVPKNAEIPRQTAPGHQSQVNLPPSYTTAKTYDSERFMKWNLDEN